MEIDWRVEADSEKSCQTGYRVWNGFCWQIAGRKRPSKQLLHQDKEERTKKDNGMKWRQIHGVEMSWEAWISKTDFKHMEEKMIPSQRRPNQAKAVHMRNKGSIGYLIFKTHNWKQNQPIAYLIWPSKKEGTFQKWQVMDISTRFPKELKM